MKIDIDILRIAGIAGMVFAFLLGNVTEFLLKAISRGESFEFAIILAILAVIGCLGALIFTEVS